MSNNQFVFNPFSNPAFEMIKKLLFILFLFMGCLVIFHEPVFASWHQRLTLDEVVAMARQQSPDAFAARHRYLGSYWQYRSHQASYLPHLHFDATMPNLNRTISAITLPDGSDAFVRRSLASSSGTLSLSQSVGLTGGRLFISSGLQRIDVFREDGSEASYLSTPVNVGFIQPILTHNRLKWERQIEPLRYKEARRQYVESLENISLRATNYFFDLLLAQINLEINKLNLSANDTLYRIAQGRYRLARIAENELLQMELNLLNSEANLEQSRIHYEGALFRFRSYLGLSGEQTPELVPPVVIPDLQIDVSVALAEARNNRSDIIANQRQLLEAESQVSQAKSDSRISANLYAVFGLNQTASDLPSAYRNLLDQQQLTFGVSVPVLDWGVSKGRVRMAESNRELVNTMVNQAMVDFEQEVLLLVMEFNMLKNQLELAQKADIIAQKRYDVTRERFLSGRIDITELNLSLEEKDRAKQRYLYALRTYWSGFYQMRHLTLYDFLNDQPIEVE